MEYYSFGAILLIVTGSLILVMDKKAYANIEWKKEKKASQLMGWTNIVLGIAVLIGNWAYQQFVW